MSRVGFSLTLALLLTAGVLGFISIRRLSDLRQQVAQTHAVIGAVEALMSSVKAVETGQRGYLLADDKKHLQPYENALIWVQSEIERLQQLTDGNSGQQTQLAGLERKIGLALDELEKPVSLSKNGNRVGALKIVHSEISRKLMEDVHQEGVAMQHVESELLRARTIESENNYRTTLYSLFLTTLTGLLLVCVVYYLNFRNINDLRSASALLAEERERLRITLASIGDAVISTDVYGNVTYLNGVAETLTGWKNEEARGIPLELVFRIINESTRQPIKNPAIRALQDGVIVGLANHTILISRDLEERPIDDSAAPIYSRSGEIVGSVLVFRDISARKQIERESAEAQSRLASTLAAGEVGTWEFDILQNVVRADQNLARMFGVPPDVAVGGSLGAYIDAIHPDDRDRMVELLGRALESDAGYELEYRVIGSDQIVRWVVARGRIERDESGVAIRSPGVVMDITARRTVENQLRASEQQRRLALDAAELGSWNIDPLTNTLVSDERFQLIFSGQASSMTYEQAFSLIHPEDRDRVREAVSAALRPVDPAPYAEEYRVVHPQSGDVRWVLGKGRANFEGQGSSRKLVSFDGTVADISDRKKMENDLRQLAANLSEADHRKDEFLATLAHELRNPLAPIRNGLQIMRLAANDEVAMLETRTMMERQLQQLVRLVDDLMDVSRISQGKLELRPERLNLAAAIDSALEASRALIDEMGHELTLDVPTQPVFVHADLTRLAQVFMNLLNNAAKYSEPNGHIWITAKLQGSHVRISVKDRGIGIANDQLPRIFDLFSQIDRSLEKAQGGLGIGLSLVKQLIEMHGGTIEARSEGNGRGAEFIVELPVMLADPSLQRTAVTERVAEKSALRILVVDDNRDSADSLAMMLTALGNDTRTAYDGEQAVAVAAEMCPAVIFLDIGLPKLNGHEACSRIRQQPGGREIVIIAQTGWGQEEDRQRTQDAGFNHHLVKPIDPTTLIKLLASLSECD